MCRRQSSTIQASLKNPFHHRETQKSCIIFLFVVLLFCRQGKLFLSWLTVKPVRKLFSVAKYAFFRLIKYWWSEACWTQERDVCCHFFLCCVPHEIFNALIGRLNVYKPSFSVQYNQQCFLIRCAKFDDKSYMLMKSTACHVSLN